MVFIGGWGSPVGRTDDQIFTTYGASDSYRIVASVDYVFGFTNAIYWQDLYVQRIQQGSSPSINDPTWKIREGERRTYYNSMFEFEGTYDMKSGPGAGELRLRDGTGLSKLELYQNASVQHTYWISDPKVVVNGDTVDYGSEIIVFTMETLIPIVTWVMCSAGTTSILNQWVVDIIMIIFGL